MRKSGRGKNRKGRIESKKTMGGKKGERERKDRRKGRGRKGRKKIGKD